MFTGMVMVVQTGETMKRWGTEAYVSEGVALVILRELGPVLAGFLVAGRIGSGIAAELGAMAVSEQIDAMKSLGRRPIKKLVVPKVVAGMFCLPMLAALADFIGILGGMVMAMTMLHVPPVFYFSRIQETVVVGDFMSGIVKTGVLRGDHLHGRLFLRAAHDRRHRRRRPERHAERRHELHPHPRGGPDHPPAPWSQFFGSGRV